MRIDLKPFVNLSKPWSLGLLGALLLLPVTSCARTGARQDFATINQEVQARSKKRAQWPQSAAERDAVRQAVNEALARPLTADTAAQIALLNNDSMQATYEELGIARAEMAQAGLPKNPTIDAEIRFPAAPKAPLDVHVIQDVLDLLYLPLKRSVAKAEYEAAKLRLTHEVLNTATETKIAFYDLLAAQQKLETKTAVTSATEVADDAARRRYRAGNLTDLELAQEQASHAESRMDRAEAEQATFDLREKLNQMMGLWGNRVQWTTEARLPDPAAEELDPGGLERLAINQRLDLASSWQQVVAAARTAGMTRFTSLFSDSEGGFHYERESDGSATRGPSLGFTIPLFDWGQARRAKARGQFRQAELKYHALAVQIRSEVREAAMQMRTAQRRANFARQVQMPLRQQAVHHAKLQYNAMQIGVNELLKFKQEELEASERYIDAAHDYWVARSRLEAAVGGTLPGANTSHEPLPAGAASTSKTTATEGMHHHGE